MNVDAIIIGGGPAGSIAAIELCDRGKSVLLVDRENFPRFRIGESFLPKTVELLSELGLEDRLRAQPHWIKRGIEIGFGDGRTDLTPIAFSQVIAGSQFEAFNMRRSVFDQMLLDAARDRGAQIRMGISVDHIDNLEQDDVRVRLGDGTAIKARMIIDASGQAAVLGRHLGQRKLMTQFRNVAAFQHFDNVKRPGGDRMGFASIVMCREGWFWMIPLDEKTTSVGAVVDERLARRMNCAPRERLRWCIDHCPVVSERMADAVGPDDNQVVSDFSYTCAPYAGPGWFLVGDAATFIDPVWSTGATLGMLGGRHAGSLLADVLDGRRRPVAAAEAHNAWIAQHRKTFLRLIGGFYDHAFRELVIEGKGPLGVHRALITLLAGEVFPSIKFRVRWRWELLEGLAAYHRRFGLVGKRRPHSMLSMAGIDFESPDEGVVAGPANEMRRAWRTA